MQVTVGDIHDAMFALTQIIKKPRVIPQTGKFRIAKLHAALLPFHEENEKRRGELIQKYGTEQFQDEAKTVSVGWGVSENTPGFDAYQKEWAEIRKEPRTLPASVSPLKLSALGDDPKGIEAGEFVMLGCFVEE